MIFFAIYMPILGLTINIKLSIDKLRFFRCGLKGEKYYPCYVDLLEHSSSCLAVVFNETENIKYFVFV